MFYLLKMTVNNLLKYKLQYVVGISAMVFFIILFHYGFLDRKNFS